MSRRRTVAAATVAIMGLSSVVVANPMMAAAAPGATVTSYTTNTKAQNAHNLFFFDFKKLPKEGTAYLTNKDGSVTEIPAFKNGVNYTFTHEDGLPNGMEIKVTLSDFSGSGVNSQNKTWNAIFEGGAETVYGEAGYNTPAGSEWLLQNAGDKTAGTAKFKIKAEAKLDGVPTSFDIFATDGESTNLAVKDGNTDTLVVKTNGGEWNVVQDIFPKTEQQLREEMGGYFDVVYGGFDGGAYTLAPGTTNEFGKTDLPGYWFGANGGSISTTTYQSIVTESDARLVFDAGTNKILTFPKDMPEEEMAKYSSSQINPFKTGTGFTKVTSTTQKFTDDTKPNYYCVANPTKLPDKPNLAPVGWLGDCYTARARAFYSEMGWDQTNFPLLPGDLNTGRTAHTFRKTMANLWDAVHHSGNDAQTKLPSDEVLAKYGITDTNKGFRQVNATSGTASDHRGKLAEKNGYSGLTAASAVRALQSQPILLSKSSDTGGVTLDVELGVHGSEGIAAGIFLPADNGDAPSSYGSATHLLRNWELYGQVANATRGYPNQEAGWKINSDGPYLGHQPAHEDTGHASTGFNDDWEEDLTATKNTTRGDFPQPYLGQKGYTAVIPVTPHATETTYVRSWVDFNDNGTFDDNEASELIEVPAGAEQTHVKLDWPKATFAFNDKQLTYGGYAIRTRISSGDAGKAALDKAATTADKSYTAPNGEVEDLIIAPLVPVDAETYGPQGVAQKSNESTAAGTSTDGRDKGISVTQMFPHLDVVAKDLANSIDGKKRKTDGELTRTYKLEGANAEGKVVIDGQGTYSISDAGLVTFTPEKSFSGDPKPVTVIAVLGDVAEIPATYTPHVDPTIVVVPPQVVDEDPSETATLNPIDITANNAKPDTDVTKIDLKTVYFSDEELPTGAKTTDEGGNFSAIEVPGEGTWTIERDPDGNFTGFKFVPETGFVGDPTPVNYTAKNINGVDAKEPAQLIVRYYNVVTVNSVTTGPQGTEQHSDDKDPGDQGVTPADMFPTIDAMSEEFKAKVTYALQNADGTPTDSIKVDKQGTYSIAADGTVTFEPEPEFTGTATPVTVLAQGLTGVGTISATYTPTVTPVNVELPKAQETGKVGDTVKVTPGYDPSIDKTTIKLTTDGLPTGSKLEDDGSVTVPGQGTWTVDTTTGEFTFTPEKGFAGDPTPMQFTGKNTDGVEAKVPGTVTVTYDDLETVDSRTFGPQGKTQDSDDTDEGDAGKTVQEMFPGVPESWIQDGTVTFKLKNADPDGKVVVKDQGTYTIDENGKVTFTPLPEFTGEATPVTVITQGMKDQTGQAEILEATYTPYVDPQDVVVPSEQVTKKIGETAVIEPTYDKDVNPATIVIGNQGLPEGSTITDDGKFVTIPSQGTWEVDENGKFTFTPVAGFTGTPTPVYYTAKNTDGVVSKNAGLISAVYPDISAQSAFTTANQGVTQTSDDKDQGDRGLISTEMFQGLGTIPENWTDFGYTLIDSEGEPTDTIEKPGQGVYTIDTETGEVTFVPEKSFTGNADTVTVSTKGLKDALGKEANVTATYTPTVVGVVVEVPSSEKQGELGQPVKQTLTFVDTIDKSSITLSTKGLPDGSKVENDGSVTVPNQGTWTVDKTTGEFTFTPVEGFMGDPTPITYTATNNDGVPSVNEGTVKVTYPVYTPKPAITTGPQGENQDSNDVEDLGDKGLTPAEMFPGVPADEAKYSLEDADKDGKVVVDGQGTYTIKDGVVTFDPEPDFVGTATPAKVTMTTKTGQKYTTTYTPTVTDKEIPPVDDVVWDTPGATTTITPEDKYNITFPNGKTEYVVPGKGTWTTDGTTLTFTPADGFTGTPTVVYNATDENGVPTEGMNSARILYPVDAKSTDTQGTEQSGTPQFPGIGDDATYAFDDGTIERTVLGEGTYKVDPKSGTVTFTPEPEFTGVAGGVTVVATSGTNTPSAKYTPTVTPKVPNVELTGVPGEPVSQTPEYGKNIDPKTVTFTDGTREKKVPGEGTWTIDPETGKVTFTPEKGFQGDPTPVEYTAKDVSGVPAKDPGTVTVTYQEFTPVPATTTGPQGVGQKSTDKDADDKGVTPEEMFPSIPADGAQYALEGANAEGQVVVRGQGTYTIDPATGVVTFTPEPTFVGEAVPAKVTMTTKNGQKFTSTYTPTVTPVEVKVPDQTQVGVPGTPVTITPEYGDNIDPKSITFVDGSKEKEVPGEGTWTIDENGTFTFTPEPGFTENPTPVVYTGTDTNGVPSSNVGKVIAKYQEFGAVPAATTGPQGVGQTSQDNGDGDSGLTPAAMFPDIPAEGATYELEDANEEGKVVVAGQGTYSIDPASGVVAFTPEPTFVGTASPARITMRAASGKRYTAKYTPTITPVTVEVPDVPAAGVTGEPVTATPTYGDNVDPSTVTLTKDGLPKGSTVSDNGKKATVPGQGTWTVDEGGKVTFTPEPGFHADPTPVAYTATNKDGVPVKDPGTVTVTYMDYEPVPATTTGAKGKEQTSGDKDAGDKGLTPADMFPGIPAKEATYKLEGANASGKVVVAGQGTYSIDDKGVVTFTPEPNFTGEATPAKVTMTTKTGLSYTTTYTPTVVPDPLDGSETGTPGTPVDVTPDYNTSVDPTTVTFDDGTREKKVPSEGTWTINPETGVFTFTPEEGFTGSPTPVTYTAKDPSGNEVENPGTVTVTYEYTLVPATTTGPQGAAQTSKDDGYGDKGVTPDKMFPGIPAEGATYSLVGANDEGKVVVPGEGTYSIDNAGVVTFTPEPTFVGEATPAQVTMTMKTGQSFTTTYTPTVTAVAPDGSASGTPGTQVSVTPEYGKGVDPSTVTVTTEGLPEGSTVTEDGKTVTVPGQGTWTVEKDGKVSFTPEKGFQGNPTPVKYTAKDPAGNAVKDPGTITVTYTEFTPVPATTTGPQGAAQTSQDTGEGDKGLTPDKMFPGIPAAGAQYRLEGAGEGGKVVVAGQGTYSVDPTTGVITFTPEPGFVGTATPAKVTMTTKTGQNYTTTYTPTVVGVTVEPVHDQVVGTPGTPVTVTPVEPVTDITFPNGKTEYTVPGEGTWTTDGTTLKFTPESGFTGSPSVFYSANRDGVPTQEMNTAKVIYPQPVVTTDGAGKEQTGKPEVPGATKFTFPEGKTTVTTEGEGTYTINEKDGTVTFTPVEGFTGKAKGVTIVAATASGNVEVVYTPTVTPEPEVPGTLPSPVEQGQTGKPVTVSPEYPEGVDVSKVTFEGGNTTVTVDGEGTWTISNGEVTFTPASGFVGSPTPVEIVAEGYNPGTVSVVYPALVPVPANTVGDQGASQRTLLSDMFPGADTTGAQLSVTTVEGEGTYAIDPATGEVVFTPEEGFTGQASGVDITVTVGGQTYTAHYTPVVLNTEVPLFPAHSLNNEPGSIVKVTPQFAENVDPATVVFANGEKTLVVEGEGTWTVSDKGEFTFTPADGFTGNPTPVTYVASTFDGVEAPDQAQITVTYGMTSWDRCWANAKQSPLLWLMPAGLAVAAAGKFAQPYVAEFGAQLDQQLGVSDALRQIQRQMPTVGNPFQKQVDQLNELGAKLRMNIHATNLLTADEVRTLGIAAGVVGGMAAMAGLFYHWCTAEPGDDGSSTTE